MTLLNPALLYGLLLAALPVVLHLLLRRKPKPLVFPALRLIQQRRKQNLKRIQLRHIWLLLLRILAIGLIVLALTRPSLPAADYSFNPREWLTLAGVIAAGVAFYFWQVRRWRSAALPRHVFALRRATARGWITGGTLLGLLLLVGCPYQHRIAAEIKAPPPAAQLDLPAAAVFLFDTSLSLTYQQGGKTRLDVARQIAAEHLGELPSGSRVSIVDTNHDYPVQFQPTLSAAQTRMAGLVPGAVNLSLSDRLRTCLLAQEEDRRRTLSEQGNVAEDVRQDRFLRRVYIFTDLTRIPWRLGGSNLLAKEIERLQTINVFLVDVGETAPNNRSLLQVKLSRQQVPVGGQLAVSALVQAVGEASGEATLELQRTGSDGRVTTLGKAQATLDPTSPQWVSFPLLSELSGPVLHGEVRIDASDPLTFDDVRRFTVSVGEPPRVLVSAPSAAVAADWLDALNPGLPKFRTEFVPATRLRQADFSRFDVVYLLNIPQLDDSDWSRLATFVQQGGGLGLFLGNDTIRPSSYERAPAQAFLPARPEAVRERTDRRLSIDQPEHPVFRKLSDDGGVPILEQDVYFDRYWVLTPAPGAAVLATFTDEDRCPAFVERSSGKGRSVLFASAVDPAQGAFSRWTNFSDRTQIGWPFLAFAESLTLYLARSTDNVFNIHAGEDALLHLPATDAARSFLLKRPEFRQTRVTLPAGEGTLVISDAHDVGAYTLVDAARPDEVVQGFSVSPPPAESDLSRLETAELDQLFGEGRYQVARSIGELDASVNMADLGREVFPIVLLLAIVAFLGEHLVANRFYEMDDDVAGTPAGVSLLRSRPGVPAGGPTSGTTPSSGPPVANGPADRARSLS